MMYHAPGNGWAQCLSFSQNGGWWCHCQLRAADTEKARERCLGVGSGHLLYIRPSLSLCCSGKLGHCIAEEERICYLSHTQLYRVYNLQWNVFSFLTHTWSSGGRRLQRPGSCWGFGALLQVLTSVIHGQFLPEPRFEPTTSDYKSNVTANIAVLAVWTFWTYGNPKMSKKINIR